MASFRFLLALITLSLAFPLGTVAQPAPENEAALLREMLRARYAFDGQENVQILVGQLPESLPDDLPLPEEAQIIGSIVKTGSIAGGTDSTEILLRVNQSPEETYSLYQQQLLDEGWQVEEAPEIDGGFLARDAVNSPQVSSSRNSFGSFCSPSQTAHLYIDTAQSQTNSSAILKLTLNSVYSETQPLFPFECSLGIEYAPLPALTLPANAKFISGGSSSFSNDEASSDAVIETDLDAESLINHYANQLQQAGWTQVETSEVGLSRWSFQDEEGRDWQSLLIIAEIPGIPDQYASYVRVLRRSPNNS
ncbi:MAG: hypothetical protein HC879_04045 [Leptolyngbyaceae cyanobacterium SL_5_9]|nr:hypothetical protein [Leptolyngbyaceae cyanobacterium SL_5_9]NJO73228.1 hypothetical protein [Leptolyngbyaceae cyanobacterium RM1_406_9]